MRAALAVFGALLVVPFVLGFFSAVVLFCAVPFLRRWLERRVAKAALLKLAKVRHRGFYDFPPPPLAKAHRPERMN